VGRLVIRSLLSLWRALMAPGLRLGRSSVALLEEYEQLAENLAESRDLGERMALLARVGPIARELHRRGVT
jgi:hypothetical protein